MGIDQELFVSEPDQELVCPLCYGVLEEPMQGSSCDHLFCRKCIRDWLKQSSKCPVDRKYLSENSLRHPPKLISNLINKMEIRCLHSKAGCDWILKLSDVDDHLTWCTFNPDNPHSTFFQSDQSSPLKQLRLMADFHQDLGDLRYSIESLEKDINQQMDSEKMFKENLMHLESKLVELENQFKQVTDPLVKLIVKNKQNKPTGLKQPDETATSTVCISNLNEFICTRILLEYLRQQGIFVHKCTQVLGYNERSRNFQVTVRESDTSKILSPNLWPKGVVLSIAGGVKSIHGQRDTNLPNVVITSGMSYWHG